MSDTVMSKTVDCPDSNSAFSDAVQGASVRCLQEAASAELATTVQPVESAGASPGRGSDRVGTTNDPKQRAAMDRRVDPVTRADSAEQQNWRAEVVKNVLAEVKAKNWTAAALHFTEYVSANTPDEAAKAAFLLKQAVKNPSIYYKFDSDGEMNSANVDNGIFRDTPLYQRPGVKGMQLTDPDLERLAEHFEAVKSIAAHNGSDEGISVHRPEIKQAAEFLMNEALKLDKKNMHAVLKRASDMSFHRGHGLNVVFADLDGDGKPEELSDLAVNYMRTGNSSVSIERIDLYDPPVPRSKR